MARTVTPAIALHFRDLETDAFESVRLLDQRGFRRQALHAAGAVKTMAMARALQYI